jgi:CRP-like cAMP-binding protein
MTDLFQKLSQNQLFRNIPEPDLHELFKCIHYGVRKYDKGQLIAVAGDRCDNLMIILSGMVKGEMVDFSGRTIKVEDIEAPRPIAPAFLFGQNNVFPVNVTTVTESEIIYITRESFITLMQKDNRILISYLNIISNRGNFLSEKLRFLSFNTIREKLAHYILENTKMKNAVAFDPQISQTAMAEMFGVARPSLARTISELVEDGIIEYAPKWIKALKFDELQSIVQKHSR